MRIILLAALLAVTVALSYGQDFDNYKTLLPQGPVPKDFTDQTASKVTDQVTTVTGKNARQKKMKKKFILDSTFGIDDFLASGNVLFNDEVSLYLDFVLQEILKPYPDLRKKIRVYAIKSASVNAFTTNSGFIFVNLGLLSRLENEAQLAFILSHEVVHFQKQHVINAYVNNIEVDRGRGDYRKLKMGEKGFAKSTYSKELETEADLDGSAIYIKSSYAKDSIEKIFDVLKFADHPLYWAAFRKNMFETGNYIFPDTVMLNEVKAIDVNEDYDDSESSHPNIKKRREGVRAKFANSAGGEQYKVSETRFNLVREIARYELCRQFLLEHRYAESLALALSLQEENPNSGFLQETVAKAYYGLAIESLNEELKLHDEQWIGETARISHFISSQSSYELSVLALRQLYLCLENKPANVEISMMIKNLTWAFSEKHEGLKGKFLRNANDKPIKDLEHPYTQYAFLNFKNTSAFFELFDKNMYVKKKVEDGKRRKKQKGEEKKSLKVAKVVVVNPMYKKIDRRRKQKVRHIESEEILFNIGDKINEAAGKLSLKTEIINPNTITSGQVSLMQSNSILNDWIGEQMLAKNKSVSPIYNEIVALADKHKTNHFMWMGCLSVTRTQPNKGYLVLTAILAPGLIPWSTGYLFSPRGSTLYFALVFNVRTQELELVDIRQMDTKDSRSVLKSNIYYTLSNLKKK